MMKHKKFNLTIEKVVLVLAAAFAAYNFGLAGGYIENKHFSIGGLTAGVVVNVSLAIAASKYGSLKGKSRIGQARISFIGMMILSPLLVSPVIYYSLPDTFLETWWLRAIWSVFWPLVADLAIVLAGAVNGKSLVSLGNEEQAAAPIETPAQRPAAKKKTAQAVRSAKASGPLSEFPCPNAGAGCSVTKPTQNAINAHAGRCKFKPIAAMPVEFAQKEQAK